MSVLATSCFFSLLHSIWAFPPYCSTSQPVELCNSLSMKMLHFLTKHHQKPSASSQSCSSSWWSARNRPGFTKQLSKQSVQPRVQITPVRQLLNITTFPSISPNSRLTQTLVWMDCAFSGVWTMVLPYDTGVLSCQNPCFISTHQPRGGQHPLFIQMIQLQTSPVLAQ